MYWVLIGAVIALVFAAATASGMLKKSEGSEKIKKTAGAIRRGANAYLKRRYKTVAIFFVIVTIVLAIMAAMGFMIFFVPIVFIVGGVFSALAGFIGMKIATAANSRTVTGATKSLNSAFGVLNIL